MAYIPDDAIEDAPELSAPAWLLYCNLCRRRNHKTGVVIFSLSRTMTITGRSRAAIYKALAELEAKGWIRRDGPHAIIPTYGNFEPVNRRFELSPERDFSSHFRDTKSRKTRQPYKEEPALSNQLLPNVRESPAESGNEATGSVPEFSVNCLLCSDTGTFLHAQTGMTQCTHPEHWRNHFR